MTYSEIIINRICSLCQQRKLSQYKLAKMSNINPSSIDNIVRGVVKNPGIRTLHHIANGLGMTVSEFLDFKELNEFSFETEDDQDD